VRASSDRAVAFTARAVAGLAVVATAGTCFGLLLLLVRAKWGPLQHLDVRTDNELNGEVAPHPAVVAALRAATNLGGPLFLTALVSAVILVLLLRRRWLPAAYLAAAGVGGLILSPTLKLLVGRLRPVVAIPLATATGNSFPSGHTLGATIAYGSLLLVALPLIPVAARMAAVTVVALLIALVAFTRVALGVHYVSDVVGGFLLGVAWLGAVTYAFRAQRSRLIDRGSSGPGTGIPPTRR
jgi:membrane-associated phospholipid phosphatase